MKVEWDELKSEINYKKHRVTFEEAQSVFADAKAREFFDGENSEREDRFIRIGYSYKSRLLMIVFCERVQDLVRIISARKASAEEREFYEEKL